jgi:hypothetical protein
MQQAPLGLSPAGFYKTADALPEGTEFRFVAGASESAYMYAFAVSAADNTFYSPVQLFPQAGVSPLLNYSDSQVALPDGDKTLVLDAKPGMEYLVILYAKQALDLPALMRRFESATGPLAARLTAAVGANLLAPNAVSYHEKEAAFNAETDDSKAVAALVVAVEHK